MSDFDFGGAYANTARTLTQVDAAPDELAHIRALTRLNTVQSGMLEDRQAADERLRNILQGANYFDSALPMSTNLMRLGGAAMQAGDVTAGQALTLHAARTKAAESRDVYSQALAKGRGVEASIKQHTLLGNLYSAVNDQRSLDVANGIMERVTGEPTPEEVRTYDPRVIDVYRQAAITEANRLRAEHDAETEDLGRQRLSDLNASRAANLAFRKQVEQRRAQAQGRDRANAGKDVGLPSRDEVQAARDALVDQPFMRGLDPNAQRRAANDLASEARLLRKQSEGRLDAGMALQRALVNKIARGDFSVEAATGLGGAIGRATGDRLGSATRPTYGRRGATPADAIEAPADPKQRIPNTYYKTPKGVFLYLGNGQWVAPDPTLMKQATQSAPAQGGGVSALPMAPTLSPEDEEDEEDLTDERE